MRKKHPEPGVAGRDYVPAGGSAAERWGAQSDPNAPLGALNPNANGAQAWLDVVNALKAPDLGPRHANFLSDPARVALHRAQTVVTIIAKAAQEAGLDCNPGLVKQLALDLIADDHARRGRGEQIAVSPDDLVLPGERRP